ncbi:MAG: hypothetical protein RMJ87_09960 [Cytophagales bacterium]|nr:hypothetical protein [Bernardetiaceae bacterium]MDW8205342.1 hypothetical protein [Cytophagales bacterium]
MFNLRTGFYALLLTIVVLSGCNRKDPEPENEKEEINRMEVVFTPVTGGNSVTFLFSDPDGEGGNPPTITAPPLRARTTYNVTITLSKDKDGKREDKTAEIRAEADEHQFFFIINPATLMTHRYDDVDKNNRPLGLRNIVETQAAGSGTMRIVLRHDLNKAFPNLNNTNFQQAGGETDIDVTFPVTVQ